MLTSLAFLQSCRQQWRAAGKRVVFTNGCFDILHAGHVQYLEEAKKLGDILIVGLNSDASVQRLKDRSSLVQTPHNNDAQHSIVSDAQAMVARVPRPVNTENDRAAVLSALRSVDYVCLFDDDTPLVLIQALLPDVLVKGGDYTVATIVGADVVQNAGGIVSVLPFVTGKSTTGVIERIVAAVCTR
jgi:D-beta-D-heptose 7-phosphate kinase/D-beta-D-heptose 1-phosphate adenosyltransferase